MEALADRYAGIVLDLDGVCFRGDQPIPGAAETIAALRDRGIAIAFATNNASRTSVEVAAHLADLGIPADPDEIVTSARAASALLTPGTRCLVIGMTGLRDALRERGCVETGHPGDADAVVVGLDRDATYEALTRAARALEAGARFVGTNADVSLPEADGLAPGAGALLAALTATTGREPEVAGKPEPPLFETAAAGFPDGARLVVGDRIETDIAGGWRLGWDTALVLTGVTPADEAVRADPPATYVLDDISGLLAAPPSPVRGQKVIRTAAPTDDDAIIALWAEAGMLDYTPEPRRDLRGARTSAADLVLVAEREGRVVGTVLGTCDGRRGWIQRLAVASDERGHATGRSLVEEVERRLAGKGIPKANVLVLPDNREALAFWAALGYVTRPVEMGSKKLAR